MYFYIHTFHHKQKENGEIVHYVTKRYAVQARDLQELFFRLKHKYGKAVGAYINDQTGKQTGWAFMGDEYVLIEVLTQPMLKKFIMVYPVFNGENTQVQREINTIVEEEYQVAHFPLPEKKQLVHKEQIKQVKKRHKWR